MMKLMDHPEAGKPLKYELKGKRSLRVPPFRIIYSIDGENIDIITFGHRDDVYN